MEKFCGQMVWAFSCGAPNELQIRTFITACARLTSVRNRGELAEGWYDPATLQKALASTAMNDDFIEPQRNRESPDYGPHISKDSSGEDAVGPSLPSREVAVSKRDGVAGPGIPNLHDLELQQGRSMLDFQFLDILLIYSRTPRRRFCRATSGPAPRSAPRPNRAKTKT